MLKFEHIYASHKHKSLFQVEEGTAISQGDTSATPALAVLQSAGILTAKVDVTSINARAAPGGAQAGHMLLGAATQSENMLLFSVNGHSEVGGQQGFGSVLNYIDRRHIGFQSEVTFTSAVGFSAGGGNATIDSASVNRSVKNLFTGIDTAGAQAVSSLISVVDDSDPAYTGLFFRLLALLEAVSNAETLQLDVAKTVGTMWPNDAATWGAALPTVQGILSGGSAGTMLDVSRMPLGVGGDIVRVLALVSQPHLGVFVGQGGQHPGLAHYCGQVFDVVLYGHGSVRPQYPAGAITAAQVCSAINFVLAITSDSPGLETALRFAAGLVRFLGPEQQHLPSSIESRLFNVGGPRTHRASVFWALCQSIEIDAWAQSVAGLMVTIDPDYVDADRPVFADVRVALLAALNHIGAGYVDMARRSPDLATFWSSLTTNEMLHLLDVIGNLAVWDQTHGARGGWVQGGQPAHLVGAGNAPSVTRLLIEASLPGHGMDGQFDLSCATGLGALRDRVNKFNLGVKAIGTRFPILSADGFRKGFYLLANGIRAACDTAVFNMRASRLTRQFTVGEDAGLDARLELLLRRKVGDSSFDAATLHFACQASIAELLGVEWEGRDGVKCYGSFVPDFFGRDRATIPAVCHPVLRGLLIGDARGPGGALSLHAHELTNRAAGYVWDGALESNLVQADGLGVTSIMGSFSGLWPRFSLSVTEEDLDLRRRYSTTIGFAELGRARVSDAAPFAVGSVIPMIWWSAIPIVGDWTIADWGMCPRSVSQQLTVHGRGVRPQAGNAWVAPQPFGVAVRWSLGPDALRHAAVRAAAAPVVPPPVVWDPNDPGWVMQQLLSQDSAAKAAKFNVLVGCKLNLDRRGLSPASNLGALVGKLWAGTSYVVPSFLLGAHAKPAVDALDSGSKGAAKQDF